MKLNLGCGDRYVENWTNVDYGSPHRMDQNVDLTGPLPWGLHAISQVYAGHLFEHLTPNACFELATRLHQCMVLGGVLVAVGPDIEVTERMIVAGTFDYTYHSLESLRNGAHRWPGDEHQWETTGVAVAELLRAAGWSSVHQIELADLDDDWPVADREPLWQYAIKAWSH